MASFNKFDSFVEALAEKVHNLGSDQLKIALTNSAPLASNTVLTDITEISYTNLSGATPLNVTTSSSSQTSGTYKLVLADLVLTATGTVGPFRYVVLYNDTAASKQLIGYFDYSAAVTLLTSETFTIDFDATNGVLTLA